MKTIQHLLAAGRRAPIAVGPNDTVLRALMLMADEQGSRTVQLPSQVTLAALLATTRESVARALRQLDDSGHLQRIDRWHGELTGTHRHIFHDASTR